MARLSARPTTFLGSPLLTFLVYRVTLLSLKEEGDSSFTVPPATPSVREAVRYDVQ